MVFNRNRIGRVVLLCLYCFLAQPHVVHCGKCGGNVCDKTCREGQWCNDITWPNCNACKSCPAHTYNPDYDSGPVDDARDQCKQQTTNCGDGKKLSADSKTSKRTCSACDTGKYKKGWNGDQSCNDQTRECGPGQKLSGSPDSNLWSKNTCSACDTGKYKEGNNGDQSCKDQRKECGPGEKLSADSKTSKRTCSACPLGQYKEGNNGETNCNLCVDTRQLAGYTSYGGSTSEGDCTYCDAGSGVNAARTKCIACWDDAYEHVEGTNDPKCTTTTTATATSTTASSTTTTTATITTTTTTATTTTSTTFYLSGSFFELLEEKSNRNCYYLQLANATFFNGYTTTATATEMSFLHASNVGLGSKNQMRKVVAEAASNSICTAVDCKSKEPITLFDANIKRGPFSPPVDRLHDLTNDNVDDSLWGIGNIQHCITEDTAFVQGTWKKDLQMKIYANPGTKGNKGASTSTDVSDENDLTWVATVINNDNEPKKELSLKEFLFDAELPVFGSSASACLKAVGLGHLANFASKVPLVNKPDKPGVVELLVSPSFSFDGIDDNRMPRRMSAGLGRLTLRLGRDGSGGMLTVNILVYSAKSEEQGGNNDDEGERKWAVSFAIAKAPDAQPLNFLDTVLPEKGGGLLPSIINSVPSLKRNVRKMLFFLASAEIGIRITAGQTNIPSAALRSSGASLCSGEGTATFCKKHLEFKPDHGSRSAANSARLVASIQKRALPEMETDECNMLCYALHRMLPNDDSFMLLQGSFETSPESTKVELSFNAANVNLHIIKDVLIISDMNMFLRAEGMKFQFGFAVEAVARLENDETLGFSGEIYYQAPADIAFKLTMKGMKYDLFGWEYLHIGNLHVSGGLAPTPTLISNAGFGADVCLGPRDRCEKCVGARVVEGTNGTGTECAPLALGDTGGGGTSQGNCDNTVFARAAVMFSETKEDNYIYVEIRSDITLGSFFRALDYSDVVEKLPKFITETGIVKPEGSDAILFSFAFKDQKIETSCPPVIVESGVILRAGVNLFNVFTASLKLELQWPLGKTFKGSPSRILVDYKQSPISFKWDGKEVLALTHAREHQKGPRFFLDYVKEPFSLDVEFTGRAVVLGFEAAVSITFDNNGFRFLASGSVFGMLEATVTVFGTFPGGGQGHRQI